MLWAVAHVWFLIGWRNRLVVALNWLWNYVTFERGARLIAGSTEEAGRPAVRIRAWPPEGAEDGHDARGRLSRRRAELRGGLEPEDREVLLAALERLRMLQLVEQGLQVGDLLPEFALPDTDGLVVVQRGAAGPRPAGRRLHPRPLVPLLLAGAGGAGGGRARRSSSWARALVVISPMAARELLARRRRARAAACGC